MIPITTMSNANIEIDKDSILNSEAGRKTAILERIDLGPNESFDLTLMEASSIDASPVKVTSPMELFENCCNVSVKFEKLP